MPKRRIEEAAARTQARIDSGEQQLIGVDVYPPEKDSELNVLKVDKAKVRARQSRSCSSSAQRDAPREAALDRADEGARGSAIS